MAKRTRRWLLTSAQNETEIYKPFWKNLHAYAAHIGAEILIGPFTYNVGAFTDHTTRRNAFAADLHPYLAFERVALGNVLFCAEMNTLPTAVRPLSGLTSYTQGHWGIFPHAKVQLETVPTMPGQQPPIIMTTGCCTVKNYTPTKAGVKASFHHVVGATLLEIDQQNRHFCRQLNATEDGSFQDLDTEVKHGRICPGKKVEAITWGDIHTAQLDPAIAKSAWGLDPITMDLYDTGGMIDELKPQHQFFHDLFDGESINHWLENKPLERYESFVNGQLDVVKEVRQACEFLRASQRHWCRSHVIESNHDNPWLMRWLQKPIDDLTNAEAYHRWNLAYLEAVRGGDWNFSVFKYVLKENDKRGLAEINFIPEGDSFKICTQMGGIECGLHGHRGSNGSRGSTVALSRLGTKINKGHDHTAAILDGTYSCGVCGPSRRLLRGPHTWSASHILTYSNGKRSIITMQDGKWRA
ncbi:MAG TPA: hypothetical protein VFR24_27725 [Candidatus Angelobacter sp.]|nr:hypothetical protein [Candidatus Angelobacter sp.]